MNTIICGPDECVCKNQNKKHKKQKTWFSEHHSLWWSMCIFEFRICAHNNLWTWSLRTNYDVHKLVIYTYTLIMLTNYDAHNIVIYKYTLMMLTTYDAHKIVTYKYTLLMLTDMMLTTSWFANTHSSCSQMMMLTHSNL